MSWHHEAPERALAEYRLVPRIIGFPSTTFGLSSMPILHSSGIRLTNVRSRPKRK